MSLSLVIILFHDNDRSRVAWMTLQKLTYLDYEIFLNTLYSVDLSPYYYHF